LTCHGHEVLVVSFKRLYPSLLFPGSSQTDSSACPIQVPHEALLDSLSPLSWRRASRRLAAFQPDGIVAQWWHPFFGPAYSGLLSRFRRPPSASVVFLCHNILPHERPALPGINSLLNWAARRAFSRADGFLTHSQALVNEIAEIRKGAVVRRIFHPVYDFYSPAGSGRRGDVPHLLFFGNVRPYKGLDVFLRALALVRGEMKVEATVAGEFYVDASPYRTMVRQLGLEQAIRWQDHYIPNEEVPGLFEAADLVVLPYIEATQSGVVPLAYRFGVPVIASNVGGLSEVVHDGRTGYLVPPGQPQALAERIVQYFRENKRSEFEANIEEFRNQLNWGQVVEGLIEVVEAVRAKRLSG